ncbi:MAG: leucyl/phenylalanyl-tRNA--protein transferase [Rhodospirillales bacterium]|nr:leucyl/phenylalanyl-tRNA--protein transferase [Rhodospirillales bacterium]
MIERAFLVTEKLTPELLLKAYAAGLFPMAQSRNDRHVFWVDPKVRGVLPLDRFHVPRSLMKLVRKNPFEIRVNTAFDQVIGQCAEAWKSRRDTWINSEIVKAYTQLHHMGFVHSIEVWLNGRLVGGLYGVALGGAFFGESMFSRATDASKIALVFLVERLKAGGFKLLDTQFVTDHLRRFGAIEIPGRQYLEMLDDALRAKARFYLDRAGGEVAAGIEALFRQSKTQTS